MPNTEQIHSVYPTQGTEYMHVEKKILVVDDDVTFLKIIKKWLMWNYQVTLVKSGMQALQYIAGHRPDLILMDYDMPVHNGPDLRDDSK
ncbi:MAG: response regulator [Desulfovibrio sp.]|nr:response regulator [Desulfovibrio sp.]